MSDEKLSVRLTIHAQDCALASRDNNDMVIGFHQMNDLAMALAEAAQLARRVEEAPVRRVLRDNANYLYVGAGTAGLTEGQRVRLVGE